MSPALRTARVVVGVLAGAGIVAAAFTIANSPFGKHTQRWVWYSDARHTDPDLYSWRSLA